MNYTASNFPPSIGVKIEFRDIADNSPALIWMAGADGLCHWFNRGWLEFTGRSMEQEVGNGWTEGVHAQDLQPCIDQYMTHFNARQHFLIEYRLRRYDGQYRWILDSGTPVFDNKGTFLGYNGVCFDITKRKDSENEIRIAAIAFDTQEGMIVTDANQRILRTNSAFTTITGYSAAEAVGRTPHFLRSGLQTEEFYTDMWDCISRTGHWRGEIWNRHKAGALYIESITITAIKNEAGVVTNYLSNFIDITDRKKLEEEVRQLAFYDALTKLPNRRILSDRLNQSMVLSKRSGCYGALLFLDLDNFKPLNDLHGHIAGDLLLIEVSRRLEKCVREIDTVARFGGDEFVILLNELSSNKADSTTQAKVIAGKVCDAISAPYLLNVCKEGESSLVVEYRCTVSIGGVLFLNHEANHDELMRRADSAMYEAKQSGRNKIMFHDAMA